jgi:hypothetical protein
LTQAVINRRVRYFADDNQSHPYKRKWASEASDRAVQFDGDREKQLFDVWHRKHVRGH